MQKSVLCHALVGTVIVKAWVILMQYMYQALMRFTFQRFFKCIMEATFTYQFRNFEKLQVMIIYLIYWNAICKRGISG